MIERLKESIQRVVAWAKRNPRKAALVAAGLLGGLFLLWWLSRRGRVEGLAEAEKPEEEPVPGIPELPPVPEIPPPPPPPALPDIPVGELPPLDVQIPIPFFEPPPLEPIQLPGLPALEAPATEPVSRVSWVTAGYPEPQRSELQAAYELYRRGEWESYPAPVARTFTIRPEVRIAYEAQRAGERSAMEIARAYMARAREIWSGARPEVRTAYEAQRAGERSAMEIARAYMARARGIWSGVRPEVRTAYEAQRAGERMAFRSTPSPSAAALGLSVREAIAEHRAMRQAKRPTPPPASPSPKRQSRRPGVPE